ncbi:sulfite exporter TauE/SafE family protein [Halostagnicola sp. A-GB9-2]|uniref:sulfite exporter TauE/SafE family protein n=1 Tax=Halostagnicola sp. A-GB9-2 TaxID=3048066 RepID=UPI0024C072C7|nr:sulfite exporter TauE/SafE family protein [Halostagnicola sp. A-GB9-2]MDJ1434254.1 sulfite exporter TauE/SafE family protein [Halostagnicola sp. A-GB9-2]
MDHQADGPDTGPRASQIPSEAPPRRIGVEAEALDRERTSVERMRLPRSALRQFVLLGAIYVAMIVGLTLLFDGETQTLPLVPVVVLIAFLLETTDSAAGMGFGTGLAPLLFVLGYDPLQIVPVLLLSETLTGLVAGAVHHNVDNVTFSVRPLNEETKLLLLLVGFGSVAVLGSVVLTYYALKLSDATIKTYVSFLVLTMGAIGLLRAKLRTRIEYRPRRLVAFALLAGVNKGIGGGGYGPVVTLGQILSGVYEKSAVAITTLAEGIVSIVGVFSFLLLLYYGVPIDLRLLPSVFAGGFLAAVVAPYAVRVVPNAIWRYLIPIYAFVIGIMGLLFGLNI